MHPNRPGGKQSDVILLHTSSPTTPVLRVLANIYLRERVCAFPDAVDLRIIPLADIKARPELLLQVAQQAATLALTKTTNSLVSSLETCSLRDATRFDHRLRGWMRDPAAQLPYIRFAALLLLAGECERNLVGN